jgi:AmmeMemoRadiSam system protein A
MEPLYFIGRCNLAEGIRRDRYLSQEERMRLLEIAKSSIESRLNKMYIHPPQFDSGAISEKRGAFVSLHKNGRLRGCIGCVEGMQPLGLTVHEMACAAAFDDPRFQQLTKEELKDLEIEISVLSPLREITDINEIEVGVHGLYVVNGFYSGLLLPQVAVECKWDKIIFLEQTCNKAGLPPSAWKDENTRIYIFTADIFNSR